MTNVNAPAGLIPVRHGIGGIPNRTSRYEIASALASNIYKGSAVIPVGTNKRIDVAAAGNRIIGVFGQVTYKESAGDIRYYDRWLSGTTLATGTVAEALVYDDPFMLFGIQVSGSAGLAVGDVGAFADLVIGTGNAITGISGDMIDQTTITSTVATGGQFRIEELYAVAANDYGQYAKALVRPNEHYLLGSTTAGNAVSPI